MSTRKRNLLLAACLAAAAAIIGWLRIGWDTAQVPGPNIVLITLDTMRADRLGCYGGATAKTPNIDRLAELGVKFTRSIATAAVTPVSHASILTGLFPHSHGLRVMHGNSAYRLEEEQLTLAEMLRERGYRTGAFVSAFAAARYFGLDQGFEKFDQRFPMSETGELIRPDGVRSTGLSQRRALETTDAAIKWLGRRKPNRPFLLWVHYFDPHDIWLLPSPEYMRQRGIPGRPTNDAAMREVYDLETRYMDEHLGRLLKALGVVTDSEPEVAGDRQTLVVLVADHGEGLGDHDWWGHGILYQEQIRVPMILFGGRWRGGQEIDTVVRTVDLVPTLLDSAGVTPPVGLQFDGESLAPLLSGDDEVRAEHRRAFADSINLAFYTILHRRSELQHKDDKLYCLIEWPWKLIHHQLRPAETELYHLRDDPSESNNLAAVQAEKLDELQARLEEMGAITDLMPTGPMDAEAESRLRSLGYHR